VNAGKSFGGADRHALTEGGNDFNLLVARKVVHGGSSPSRCGLIPKRTLEKQRGIRYISQNGHSPRVQSGVGDPLTLGYLAPKVSGHFGNDGAR
jgi:hypothetical protein